MKKTLTFTVRIEAPRALVWDTMLGPETFKAWTAAFCEGSYYTGSWEQGAKIRFLAPNGEGMTSEIAETRPHAFVSIRHLGNIADGVEDTTSDEVRSWAPAYENYTFSDVPGGTEVRVDVDVLAAYEGFMQEAFPRALQLLKAQCEARQAGRG